MIPSDPNIHRALEGRIARLERRISSFEEITGVVLPPDSGKVDMVESSYDSGTEVYTLTWQSQPTEFYKVERSVDLITWVVVEAYLPPSSGLTTTWTADVPIENAPAYFRVRKLPSSC